MKQQKPKTLYLASKNQHKLREINEIIADTTITCRLATALGGDITWNESGNSFIANALEKARALKKLTQEAVLADDSGLVVRALGGAPGIFSSRYAGKDATDHDNNLKLLNELAETPKAQRTASFVCALVYIPAHSKCHYAYIGQVHGTILTSFRGYSGFGYDPLFLPLGKDKTFGEQSQHEKNKSSHRHQALRSWRQSFA